jgi:DNA helicase II / ATP-dependent DNA helicase PcrA
MTSFLQTLNPEQREAVSTLEGRLLILAGAGSGKTRVLTTRMAYLIQEKGVSPSSILGLTFTNKAAQEMGHRLAALLSKSLARQVNLCTFHSFCMQVLREEIHHLGFTRDFSLYDEKDLERLVKLIARDLLEHEGELPSLSSTLHAISKANQKEEKKDALTWHDRFASEVRQRLKASFRAYNAVDFDHLLTLTVELFSEHPAVLRKYQERYRYLMIDEYQDTNPIQFRLAELLSSKYQNLCVVGDDDQAIYGWRGAEVANILNFGAADAVKVIKLEQNYRSHNIVLKAANAIICNNSQRHKKVLWSQNGPGELIEVFVAPQEQDEAEAVVGRIIALKSMQGLSWSDIAILYRSNALSRSFEIALLKAKWQSGDKWETGIPYEIFGGVEFYERREVKDLLAYLRAILNPLDEEALLRIINLPRRGIGETSLDQMTALSRAQNIPLWKVFEMALSKEEFPQKARNSLKEFLAILKEAKERFQTGPLAETLRWLIERTKFKKCIEDDVKSDKMRAFKWENVEELVSALAQYEEENGEKGSLHHFVSTMTLHMQADKFASQGARGDKVNLMTFHSAKGLEFEACFLVGLEDHLIPHEKSLKETGIEEERRLMYVAVTRAKKWLTLSMVKQRKRMGKDAASRPSRFLFEIPKELIKPVEWHAVPKI